MEDKEALKKIKASVVMDFGDKTYAILMGDKDICVKRSMLIETAPELLAVLQLIISYHDDGNRDLHREDLEIARQVIAKALGQQ
ncbi:MAG: hypothetical protein ACTH5W_19475 [Providencia sp.]|uniref:hypothetical protein n=1 Tax=Providencia sp. TaxID=589 RepID=UPI003F9CC017